jgi:hypothetical protein
MRIGNFSFVIMLGIALGGGSQSMMRRVVRTWRDSTCLARADDHFPPTQVADVTSVASPKMG